MRVVVVSSSRRFASIRCGYARCSCGAEVVAAQVCCYNIWLRQIVCLVNKLTLHRIHLYVYCVQNAFLQKCEEETKIRKKSKDIFALYSSSEEETNDEEEEVKVDKSEGNS